MKFGILAAAAALALSSPVMAGDWRMTGSNDETIMGFDIDSLVVVGTKRTAWEIIVRSSTSSSGVDYYMSRTEYDCSSGRSRSHALATYALDGRSERASSSSLRWEDIYPDSIAHDAFEVICGRKIARSLNIETSTSFALTARAVLAGEN